MNIAIFGGGCFWCIEAIFAQVNGVKEINSGYTGGTTKNPTYEEICSGKTGHTEVCKIVYNPKLINYKQLLEIFFKIHDPTTLNQQGQDIGSQYRSAIYYINSNQKEKAKLNQL